MKRHYQKPTIEVIKYQMKTYLLSGSEEPEEPEEPEETGEDGDLIRNDYGKANWDTWE